MFFSGEVCSPCVYAGNLTKHLLTWRKITSDPWILETVSGYHLEFSCDTVQTSLPCPPILSSSKRDILDEEFHKLLGKGAIEKAVSSKDQFISNISLVPKKTGDLRPVINLKPLNEFVSKIDFKMENISLIKDLVGPGDFLASFDLKDAYFSISIFKPHRKYLRFFWSGELFQFTCLPFGYSLAPRVFTKVLKPVLAFIRFKGVRAIIFIDDILVIATTADECLQHLSSLIELLESLRV